MDIDIDFKNRDDAIEFFKPIIASRFEPNKIVKHNVGVYFQNIPTDPISGLASIDYKRAEELGYTKIDFLNLHVYEKIKDNDHLDKLVNTEPVWELLQEKEVVSQLFQLHTEINTELCLAMKPANLHQLAMVLALSRPGKMHLIGKSWEEIEKEIWEPTEAYYFKKAHSYSYAMVIVVQLNLLVEELLEVNNEE